MFHDEDTNDLKGTHIVEHEIHVGDTKPIRRPLQDSLRYQGRNAVTSTEDDGDFKMASSGEDVVEDALNILLNVTEKSGNLRNDLRKDILKAVSNLRKEFASLKCEVEDKNKLTVDLENRVVEVNSTLKALQLGVDGNCRGKKGGDICRFASELQGH